ncbi:60 kDa SS-A/Ro ribonucleoprotein [Trichomycterus rosablanca]|uniref:60 kDa SS-A/Ro ribonucleoprotein n=1 Tax=Trichomycterus rosablanca TaxID=2290929 RepID=UPI002F35A27A
MDQSSPPEQLSDAPVQPDTNSDWTVTEDLRLRRFLCYGSQSATYSAREKQRLTPERASTLTELLDAGRGCEVVHEVRQLSRKGGAKSVNPALFALAAISQRTDAEAKRAAYGALGEVCASPGELFTFVRFKKELSAGGQRGMWGRALRKAVANWYNGREPLRLARDVTKCMRMGGWSHQDLFRLAHFKPGSDAVALVSKYVTKGWREVQEVYGGKENPEEVMKVLAYLEAVEKAKHSSDEQEVAHLIEEQRLEREHLLTKHLKSTEVWRALLKDMPLTDLLSHLGKMSVDQVLAPGNPDVATVCERIQDEQALLKTKTHPLSITVASETYRRGHGIRGKLKWEPNLDVIQALDSAFYKCLQNVEPSGKRLVLGVDVSSRLGSIALGSCISTVTVAAAMSLVITRTEPNSQVLLFSGGTVVPCPVSTDASLLQITTQLVQADGSGTDCALPVTWASENDRTVDVFIILTNNETWTGRSSPAETLRTYRRKTSVSSKLIVCAMTTNIVCVADPDDGGMLDVGGFDSHAIDVIRNFITDVI